MNHGAPVPCTDCGREFRNRPDETGALCDECADARDSHTSTFELRMATVRPPAAAVKEIA
jgi:hypothetical protein